MILVKYTMKEVIQKIWNSVLEGPFQDGMIGFERQLQGYLFYELINHLPHHKIWLEPMVYLTGNRLDGKKPDIIITKGRKIVGVWELKFNPWGYVHFKDDIQKLLEFEKLGNTNETIPLSWPPKKNRMPAQLAIPGGQIEYSVNKSCLMIFGVVAHPYSEALLKLEVQPKNFLHLTGYIDEA